MLETIDTVTDNEDARYYIGNVRRGIDKMNTLVADILELLQLETEVNLEKKESKEHLEFPSKYFIALL